MGRAACVIAVAGGAGCAQLFGIDNTSGAGADAHPGAVSAQIQRITIAPTVVRTPEDISHLTASWLVADAAESSGLRRVPAMVGDSTDTWTAPILDGTPAFELTLGADYPDTFRRLYAFPQRDLKILYGVAEQPSAAAAPPAGILNVTVNLPTPQAAGEAFQLDGIGAWANHGLSTAELAPGVGATKIGPTTIAYTAATWGSTSGRPLTEITKSDLVVGLRYINNYELTGVAEFNAFDQTGGTDAITATMTNNARTPLDVHVDPPAIAARLAMPSPAGTSAVALAWSAVAAPGYSIANNNGPLLNYGTLLATDTGAVTAGIGNPFVAHDWRSTFTWASNKSRTFAIPALNNQTVTLYCGINEIAEVSAGLTLDAPAPLPVLVTINSTALTTDGQMITLDATKSVTLAMVTDTGTALFYQWNIYELKPNANGTTIDQHIVYAALAVDKMVTIPNDVFAAGKVYQIRGHAIVGGYPTFAEGNLWTRNLPYSVGYLDAGIFTVAP